LAKVNYQDLSDASLMEQVCSGEHDAFAEIVARHTDRFFALAFRTLQNTTDAEDVVQNAFIKLWRNPSSWNSSKSQFTTWFYRVVINACHDHIRKQKSSFSVDDESLESLVEPTSCEQEVLEKSQLEAFQQQALNDAIKSLPSSQRDALNLVVYLGLPQKEVAEIMGVSLKAVESLLVRAKRSIATFVKRYQSNAFSQHSVHNLKLKSEN